MSTVTDRRLEALQSLARELVQRGHDPECTTGSGPCERCARAYAGRQVLNILDPGRERTHQPSPATGMPRQPQKVPA